MLSHLFPRFCWQRGKGQRAEEGYEDQLPLPVLSLCWGPAQGASVAVKGAHPSMSTLPAIQTLSRSLMEAEINAPIRQMNPERIGASNREKWWRLWPTFLPCKSHLHFSVVQPNCTMWGAELWMGMCEPCWANTGCCGLQCSSFWAQVKESEAGNCIENLDQPN